MDPMHRVHIKACLKTQESSIALHVLIGEESFFHHLIDAFGEDIVFDAIGEDCHLCRD